MSAASTPRLPDARGDVSAASTPRPRGAATIALAVAVAFALASVCAPGIAQVAGSQTVFDTITWPRPLADAEIESEWHLPAAAAPQGLVLLQHGFSRRCANVRGTAAALAEAGWAVLCLNADMSRGNPALAQELADALMAGRVTAPDRSALPAPWIVAGHSAGGLFAALLGEALLQRGATQFAGAVLFDPVATRGPAFAKALQAIAGRGRPVMSMHAQPGPCNANGRGREALAALLADFGSARVELIDLGPASTHVDVEADDTDALAVRVCRQGAPQTEVVERVRRNAREFLKRAEGPRR